MVPSYVDVAGLATVAGGWLGGGRALLLSARGGAHAHAGLGRRGARVGGRDACHRSAGSHGSGLDRGAHGEVAATAGLGRGPRCRGQGCAAGHTIFLVRNAVKDLDLALKLTSPVGRLPRRCWSSRTCPPHSSGCHKGWRIARVFFSRGRPCRPPGRIVLVASQSWALARRGGPRSRGGGRALPELRFIELVTDGRGQVTGRDRTEPRP